MVILQEITNSVAQGKHAFVKLGAVKLSNESRNGKDALRLVFLSDANHKDVTTVVLSVADAEKIIDSMQENIWELKRGIAPKDSR